MIAGAAVFLVHGNSGGPATEAGERQITVSVVEHRVMPPTARIEVARGTVILMTVTSDIADELHVHGYDRRAGLPAGVPVSVRVRADTTGLFEVETHHAHLVLFQLVVR